MDGGFGSFIGGGVNNEASGRWSVVPGGFGNKATNDATFAFGIESEANGQYSMTLGERMVANHDRVFMWGHNNFGSKTSVEDDAFYLFPNAPGGDPGSVFIGTTNRLRKVTIDGWISVNGCDGCGGGSSDIRLKEHIMPISNALERVAKLNGVNYYWKNKEKFGDGLSMGVIAQDVEQVFPELVMDDEDGFKAVDYRQLSGALIEAIKDLKQQNDDLKKRVEALESKTNLPNR